MSQGRFYRTSSRTQRGRAQPGEQTWRCLHCKLDVVCASSLSGVQNRNHYPYCLWSRHLDWRAAGDRLSACRAGMRPVGLTTKQIRNKYAGERDGELMIIHQCVRCAKLMINRIAADDGDTTLLALFEDSCAPDAAFQAELAGAGIAILTAHERELVRRRLRGQAHAHLCLEDEASFEHAASISIGHSQHESFGVQFLGRDPVDLGHDLVLAGET